VVTALFVSPIVRRLFWQAGGFPAESAELIGEMRGIGFVPVGFGVADYLEYGRAEIPSKAVELA
jgi:hypothetical protein